MAQLSKADAARLRALRAELKVLETALAEAERREGKDPYISVTVKKNQGRFERIRQKGAEDKVTGKYYLEIAIQAKQRDVYIPISIASGKKVAGFMYQIEGTAAGSLATAEVAVRGERVSQITLGTLRFARVSGGSTALFRVQATIRGKLRERYAIIFTRLNYKLDLAAPQYEQYLKPLSSKLVTFA